MYHKQWNVHIFPMCMRGSACRAVSCQKKKKSSRASAKKLNQEVKIKGMYTVSLNQAHKPVEPQRELWNAAAVRFCIKLVSSPFPNFTQYLILPAVFLFDLFFSSAVSLHSNNVHSHTWVWYSSACLVQCRQPVGLLLCTTTRKGAITLVKVLDCVSVCVYVCVFQTDPLIHRTAAHLICLLTRQRYSTVCLMGLSPCCRWASVRRWWLDTTALPSGCLRSLTSSWLVSSSPCICHRTTVR